MSRLQFNPSTLRRLRNPTTGRLQRAVSGDEYETADDCNNCEGTLWEDGKTPKYVKLVSDYPHTLYLIKTPGSCMWTVCIDLGSGYYRYRKAYWNIINVSLTGSGVHECPACSSPPTSCSIRYQKIGSPACASHFEFGGIAWDISWGPGIGEAEYLAQSLG